jgi:hypothetical protein
VRQAAGGAWEPDRALDLLDGLRWLDRVAYHSVRACDYLTADVSDRARDERADESPGELEELEEPAGSS